MKNEKLKNVNLAEFQEKAMQSVNSSVAVKMSLLEDHLDDIVRIGTLLGEAVKNGGMIMFCGNGGSAADAQHLAAELVVRLRPNVNRGALPGLALTVDPSIITAGGNDYGFDSIFARGVEAYGKEGDVLICISTSGNSENVLQAVNQAKKMGVTSIGLLGNGGGKIGDVCDDCLIVPSENTARTQESHIMIGHIWCEIIEEVVFPELFTEE
jgi:D-sedoheptulose 7-phosphate isomerase